MITAATVDALLSALGGHLERAGASLHRVVVGGSGLLAIGIGDRATQDVDVVALVAGGLVSAEPFPEALRTAAERVAADFQLHDAWLNSGPTSLLDEGTGLPAGFLERAVVADYGPALRVSFAGRVDQIHLKLMALADRGYPRDEADLRQLEPTADELGAAASWAREHFMPGPYDNSLASALARFGVEDAGRDA